MARDLLELRLNRLTLAGALSVKEREERLLICTLIWPRPLVAERISSKALTFAGTTLDLADADWMDRILFKETVEGHFGLVLQVTEPVTEAKRKRFLAQWGAGVLRLAGTETAKLAADPWMASITRIPLQLLGSNVGETAKDPAVIAAGRITLQPGSTGPLRLPLVTVRDRYHTETRRIGNRRVVRRVRAAEAGAPAGEIELELEFGS